MVLNMDSDRPRATAGLVTGDLVARNVAILGAGREGLAVRDRLRALAPNQELTFYCESPPDAATMSRLGDQDRLKTGPLDGAELARHDVLVRSPGISPYRPPLREARQAGVAFTSGTNLWMAEHPEARTLCVTGTKGKSTTSALLHHLLREAGGRAGLAGNIGLPLIGCDAKSADWWVVELSSYQICDLEAPPWATLFLNLSDEHLDWHGGADNYRRDKLRLARLAPVGRLFANGADPALRSALADRPDARWFNRPPGIHLSDHRLWEGGQPLPPLAAAPGDHNLVNLAGALAVVDALGLRPDPLEPALGSFRGLPHRLATLGSVNGIHLVDDSLSTTPVATLAALQALRDLPAVTVLVGGMDRGLDWTEHAEAFRAAAPHAIVSLPDSGPRVIEALASGGVAPPAGLHLAADMAEAVARALELTPAGGAVLLSPGAPSFPHYADYRERAAAFADAAKAMGEMR
jgi:UDP-N-acetylmuramoylalanine--D-glutamate ligase